jgi:hypothetical protein
MIGAGAAVRDLLVGINATLSGAHQCIPNDGAVCATGTFCAKTVIVAPTSVDIVASLTTLLCHRRQASASIAGQLGAVGDVRFKW